MMDIKKVHCEDCKELLSNDPHKCIHITGYRKEREE